MAKVTLRLVQDPETGKRNVIIGYEGDSGSLPMEHEADHKAIVEKLIEGGTLDAASLGNIIIERPEKGEELPGNGQNAQEESPQRRSLDQNQ